MCARVLRESETKCVAPHYARAVNENAACVFGMDVGSAIGLSPLSFCAKRTGAWEN